MFWEYNQISSQISTLLQEEDVNLSDLLDQDDIVQECCSENKKLIEFLIRPNVVHELLQLTLEEPPDNDDLLSKYKHSSRASQVIASGMPLLNDAIVKDPACLEKLYNFIKLKPPLNPLLASFFAKTIQVLLMQKSDWYTYQVICLQVIEFFKNCPDFVPRLVEHIGTSAIMNCLQYISEVSVDRMEPNVSTWLDLEGLIEKLIAVICGQYSFTIESSVEECVTKMEALNLNSDQPQVSESQLDEKESNDTKTQDESTTDDKDPKSETIESDQETSDDVKNSNSAESDSSLPKEEPKANLVYPKQGAGFHSRLIGSSSANAAQLMSYFIANGRRSDNDGRRNENSLYIKCVLEQTIKSLLENMFKAPENFKKQAIANGIQVLLTLLEKNNGDVIEYVVTQEENFRIAEIIIQWIPFFKDVLLNPPEQSIDEYNNFTEKPFGIARLNIAKLFVCLISTDNQNVCKAIIDHDIFNIILNLFFEYKWNSFLHFHMKNALIEAFKAPTQNKTYVAHLLKDCALIDRIMDAWNSNTTDKNNQRCGYMGHLINIAFFLRSELSNLTVTDQEEFDLSAWDAFYEENLVPVYKLQNSCPGGKPPSESASCQDLPLDQQIDTIEFDSQTFTPGRKKNSNDDEDESFIVGLPGVSEKLFELVCKHRLQRTSLDDLNDVDNWTNANIGNLVAGDDDDLDDGTDTSKGPLFGRSIDNDNDDDVLGLASKLNNCKNMQSWEKCLNDAETWTNVNIRNAIDDELEESINELEESVDDPKDPTSSREIDNDAVLYLAKRLDRCENFDLDSWNLNFQNYYPQWSASFVEPKPWGDSASSQEQTNEWADFASFETNAESEATAFPSEPFADFNTIDAKQVLIKDVNMTAPESAETNPLWQSPSKLDDVVIASTNPFMSEELYVTNCDVATTSSPEKQDLIDPKLTQLTTVESSQEELNPSENQSSAEVTKIDSDADKPATEQGIVASGNDDKETVGSDSHR